MYDRKGMMIQNGHKKKWMRTSCCSNAGQTGNGQFRTSEPALKLCRFYEQRVVNSSRTLQGKETEPLLNASTQCVDYRTRALVTLTQREFQHKFSIESLAY
uniref:Uncharacterized protein n=1 Tax=Heterorhabditis bacteriophora TaxID=37862 RepID=A0A1I7X911_HETBA